MNLASLKSLPHDELPPDFIHEPPQGFHYEVDEFRPMFIGFALSMMVLEAYTDVHLSPSGDSTTQRQESYSAPVNFSKCGDTVDIK